MLILNASSATQVSQPDRVANDRPVGNSALDAVAVVPAQPQPTDQRSAAQLRSLMDNINMVLKQSNKNLEFSVDERTQKSVFQLKDTETGDLIRQFPTEEMLVISRSIDRFQKGLLLKQEA